MVKETVFNHIQFARAYPDGIEKNYWHQARTRIISHELKQIQTHQCPTLEIGCGRGFVVKGLREQGINCMGVEAADVRIAPGAEPYVRMGLKAQDMPLDERQRYKTLLLLDVIEHFENPEAFITDLLNYFPNATALLITVPARKELWSNFDDYYGHYRRYNRSMMSKMAGALGWKIRHNAYCFRALYVPMLLWRYLGPRSVIMKAPTGIMTFVQRVIAALLAWEYLLFPPAMPGTSLLVVMVKAQPRSQRLENGM